jgi:hypothetical protein
MSSDDYARNSHYSSNRKPGQSKSHGYSPSSNYNYGNSTGSHGNTSHSNHGNNTGGGANKPFHRKPGGGGPFKRDGHTGSSDKLIKQNDIIIHLLQEIRDRLPEPPNVQKDIDGPELLAEEEMDSEVSAIDGSFESDAEDNEEVHEDGAAPILQSEGVSEQNPADYELADNDDELDNTVNGNY